MVLDDQIVNQEEIEIQEEEILQGEIAMEIAQVEHHLEMMRG